jgi:hypothetical protein
VLVLARHIRLQRVIGLVVGPFVVVVLPLIVITHRVANAVNWRGVSRGVASWLGHFHRLRSTSSWLKLAALCYSLGPLPGSEPGNEKRTLEGVRYGAWRRRSDRLTSPTLDGQRFVRPDSEIGEMRDATAAREEPYIRAHAGTQRRPFVAPSAA